jgi:hypothetical protein
VSTVRNIRSAADLVSMILVTYKVANMESGTSHDDSGVVVALFLIS